MKKLLLLPVLFLLACDPVVPIKHTEIPPNVKKIFEHTSFNLYLVTQDSIEYLITHGGQAIIKHRDLREIKN